MSVHLEW